MAAAALLKTPLRAGGTYNFCNFIIFIILYHIFTWTFTVFETLPQD